MRLALSCALICSLFASSLLADPPEKSAINWHTSMDSAWQAMKQTQRPMILFFTTDDCYFCTKMHSVTFRDHEIVSDISKNYVAAAVHVEQVPKVAERLNVQVFPTTAIISPEALVVDIIPGFSKPAEFRARLGAAKQRITNDRKMEKAESKTESKAELRPELKAEPASESKELRAAGKPTLRR